MPASDDDEITQRVRIALFVPNEAGVRGIAAYSGPGDLRGYGRAVAVRQAVRKLERDKPLGGGHDHDEVLLVADGADSPEMRLLKDRCRGELRAAFAAALGSVSPRERTILHQHYVDGLSIDVLSRLYRVHRATAARWIEAARAGVLRGVRRHLRDALGLDPRQLESAIDLVRSQLDLGLSQLLAREPGPPPAGP